MHHCFVIMLIIYFVWIVLLIIEISSESIVHFYKEYLNDKGEECVIQLTFDEVRLTILVEADSAFFLIISSSSIL